MNVQGLLGQYFQTAETSNAGKAVGRTGAAQSASSLPDAVGRALESLYPAGRLERIATMTDREIDDYAGRFGVTGAELIAAIFDPARNADYMNRQREHSGWVRKGLEGNRGGVRRDRREG